VAGRTPGRKPKLNRDLESRLLQLLEAGIPKGIACSGAGIDRRTVTNYQQRALAGEPRYVEFVGKMEAAIAKGRVHLLMQIRKHGGRDFRAPAWILEHAHSEEFSSKSQLTVNVESELERILDVALNVLGAEAAAKLFAALAGGDSSSKADSTDNESVH
jgi:hypothetical protein